MRNISPDPLFESEIPSDLGTIRIIWKDSESRPKVEKIFLPGDTRAVTRGIVRITQGERKNHTGAVQISSRDTPLTIHNLLTGIQAFLSGKDVSFDTNVLDLDLCTQFQKSVLLAEFGIPRGFVSTYGRIARFVGVPDGARAVGNALAGNPFPIVIPCHRALRSDGSLGGFQGGREMKERLLIMEGLRIGEDGRVVMDHVWY